MTYLLSLFAFHVASDRDLCLSSVYSLWERSLHHKTIFFFQFLFENIFSTFLVKNNCLQSFPSGTSFEQAVSLDLVHEVHWKPLVAWTRCRWGQATPRPYPLPVPTPSSQGLPAALKMALLPRTTLILTCPDKRHIAHIPQGLGSSTKSITPSPDPCTSPHHPLFKDMKATHCSHINSHIHSLIHMVIHSCTLSAYEQWWSLPYLEPFLQRHATVNFLILKKKYWTCRRMSSLPFLLCPCLQRTIHCRFWEFAFSCFMVIKLQCRCPGI